jgi:hypothetical protein
MAQCDGAGRPPGIRLKAVKNDVVALACCRWAPGSIGTDLYPDPDAGPLQEALKWRGAGSQMVAWDDEGVDWASFSSVVISSTWDSVERPDEFLAWTRQVAAVSKLHNPLPVIEWGFDKVHHKELAAAGVPIVPTTWVGPRSTWTPPSHGNDLVVKPSISAGARETACYRDGDPAAVEHVQRLQALGQTVMVQEYISHIEDEGETDLVFLGGVFSHAVRKKMPLVKGEGIVDRPWERMSWAGLVRPSPGQLRVAETTLAFVRDRLGCQLAYARVDLVNDPHDDPLVLEVELVDPYLSLDMERLAAKRLADALL